MSSKWPSGDARKDDAEDTKALFAAKPPNLQGSALIAPPSQYEGGGDWSFHHLPDRAPEIPGSAEKSQDERPTLPDNYGQGRASDEVSRGTYDLVGYKQHE